MLNHYSRHDREVATEYSRWLWGMATESYMDRGLEGLRKDIMWLSDRVKSIEVQEGEWIHFYELDCGDDGGPAMVTVWWNEDDDRIDTMVQEFDTLRSQIYDRTWLSIGMQGKERKQRGRFPFFDWAHEGGSCRFGFDQKGNRIDADMYGKELV